MCGIAGFVTIVPDAAPGAGGEAVLRRMTGCLRHRGPDDSGFYSDGRAFLGHRRLSIIDVAGGHQPVSNENGSVWITYNGEIFNHAAIRPRTRARRSSLRLTERHGNDPARLRGIRTRHVWISSGGCSHSRSGTATRAPLFCARDRLGIKPFYYYWDGRLFAFASEIKALLEHPSIPAEFEETLLGEYLGFGYVSGDRTLFRNIRKLMPGHHLRLSCSSEKPQIAIAQYWDVPRASERRQYVTCQSEQDWIGETRRRLEETVRMRLMSDVPLGMFLSGGVDSSAIAALIKRNTDGPVKTFAVGYCEADFSELGYAAEVARAIGTDHHEIVIGQDEFFDALPELIWHEDEPIAWPSSVSLYFVSEARGRASEGGAHRRGQRRIVRRL